MEDDANKLLISETLLIRDTNPALNRQAPSITRALKQHKSMHLRSQLAQSNIIGNNNNEVSNSAQL